MTTNTHTHRGGMPTLVYAAAIAIGTTLMIITLQHFLLAREQPATSQMDMMMTRAHNNYLRSHQHHDFMPTADLLQGADGFFSTDAHAREDWDAYLPSIWSDEFFAPLLEAPFMHRKNHTMLMEPAFKMDEDGDEVSLIIKVPDVPLEDIDVEVIGGRIVHIKGEKTTPNSHLSFDKRFTIGQHLNESNLKAKLTKSGDLVVTAPKVGSGEKEEVRKISIAEEL